MERITRINHGAGTISVGFRTTDVARHADAILASELLADYLGSIQPDYMLDALEITGVKMFGERVGIIEMDVCLQRPSDPPGSYIAPDHIQLISDAVAVVVVLCAPRGNYVAMVRQDRIAVGGSSLEIVAGLCTADNRQQQAINEVNEELGLDKWGIHLTTDDLIPLENGRRKIMLPGTCNQGIWYYAVIISMPDEFIHQFDDSEAGLEDEGEQTKVELVEAYYTWLEVLSSTDDAKTSIAIHGMRDVAAPEYVGKNWPV